MQGVLLAERFRIRDRLGAGGMGEVWSALDERMRREVAVKLVHALPRIDEAETQVRFEREVQLAGRLSHRNIVTVHDWGEVSVGGHQMFYLVMELVPGSSLRQRLKEVVPPWPMAVGWAAQIAEALHAAHLQGIIHRDIKPANVLLTPEGTAKVLDFGVAKFIGETMNVHELTATGAVLGTPSYMSPEQANGVREIDYRSDLYSLGCLLYEAVTGNPPFNGHLPIAVLRMHLDETPTEPGTLVESLPGPLNDLIMSLLAKKPEDRPLDAAAVHDKLSALLVDHASQLPGGNLLDVVQLGYADSLASRILKKSWQVWLRTQEDSASKLEEADARFAEADSYFEETRTKAEEAAAKFEAHLSKRREQAERDLSARRAEVEQQLAATESHVARLRSTAEGLRADAERAAQLITEDARRQAADIIAAASVEALQNRAKAKPGGTVPGSLVSRGTDLSPFGFELVRRGYDRAQVDVCISKLVAARDTAAARVSALEQQSAELDFNFGLTGVGPVDNQNLEGRAEAALARARIAVGLDVDSQGTKYDPSFVFDLVRQGYDRAQVDERISKLTADRDMALARISALEQRIAMFHAPRQV